ncbi:MAG: hypothetical protein NC489_43695 [Ruminococcus flavefaciens]|nr:hypothetical protein [Ruminococcus flavefaciens]
MDKLGVINLALLKTALPLAAALGDCDWNAGYIFDHVAEQSLRAHAWGFAQKFVILEPASVKPAHGYAHAYVLPADCVKMIDVHCSSDLRSPDARFQAVGRSVYTHVDPCYARYVYRELNPENWPADFCDAVACQIAYEIAALSAEKAGMVPQLMQMWQLSLARAMANDAREETERVPLDESLYASRQSGQTR